MKENEHWFRSAIFFPFRAIQALASAFQMGDTGMSLKKILAAFATYKAGVFTETWLAPNNVIVLVLMWLIYAGILVGIYSIGDISNAVNSYKNKPNESNTPPTV